MKLSRSLTVCLLLVLLCFSVPSAATATPPSPSLPPTPSLPGGNTTGDPSVAPPSGKSTGILQSYVPPTYPNLARSLWGLNVHRLDDDEAVDNFLKITECDLYSRFFLNEFEWKKIREATRTYLSKFKSSFPRRYEYIQPLLLDRYDFALKGFGIVPGSDFTSTTKLEMAVNMADTAKCASISLIDVKDYPSSMMMTLKQPFKLSFVRVNEDLAKEYLKMLEEKSVDIKAGRPAYIRLRVRLDRYIGSDFVSQAKYANFGGVLETIEVFADRDLMFKLYEQALY